MSDEVISASMVTDPRWKLVVFENNRIESFVGWSVIYYQAGVCVWADVRAMCTDGKKGNVVVAEEIGPVKEMLTR